MNRLTTHLRRNVVAYIALFVALGGTSYAAVSVRDHSLVPQKFNPTYVGGYVRAWMNADARGHLISSAGGVRVQPSAFIPGQAVLYWHPQPSSRCTSVGNVSIAHAVAPGYLVTETMRMRTGGEQSFVQVFNSAGQKAALPFTVVLLCATPR
jgi:hypothetical protein